MKEKYESPIIEIIEVDNDIILDSAEVNMDELY